MSSPTLLVLVAFFYLLVGQRAWVRFGQALASEAREVQALPGVTKDLFGRPQGRRGDWSDGREPKAEKPVVAAGRRLIVGSLA